MDDVLLVVPDRHGWRTGADSAGGFGEGLTFHFSIGVCIDERGLRVSVTEPFGEQRQRFSRSNLFYMRAFAAVWDLSDPSDRNRVKGLPWGHIIELLKLKDPVIRDWYAELAVEHKWRLEVLEHQITTGLHLRLGAAPNNLEERLSVADATNEFILALPARALGALVGRQLRPGSRSA